MNFSTLSSKITKAAGSPVAFLVAALAIFIWACLGPVFHWSEMHSLFINTLTTIITFLMVFLIQNSQNRETKALHLKIDELIRAKKEADNRLRGIETLSDEEIEELKKLI